MISIVIPVFNEREVIAQTHERVSDLFRSKKIIEGEIIYVDDGSSDGSGALLYGLVATNDICGLKVRVLRFSRNFGHSSAVYAGVEAAKGTIIAVIDCDLQDPPELIPDMVQKINEGWDVVYGKRIKREAETIFKKATAYLFYRLLNILSGVEIPRDTGDFRLMKRRVVDVLISLKEQDPFMRGLVAWMGFKQFPFEYTRVARAAGETKYPFSKMLKFALRAIVSFSNFPLIVASFIGLFGLIGCILLLGWVIWVWKQGISVPGWASIILFFGLFQSITLLILGFIGVYMGRILQEVKGRPRFIVMEEI